MSSPRSPNSPRLKRETPSLGYDWSEAGGGGSKTHTYSLSVVRMVNVVNFFVLMAFALTNRHWSFGELGEWEGDNRIHRAVRVWDLNPHQHARPKPMPE
jgi:hypothetical protein